MNPTVDYSLHVQVAPRKPHTSHQELGPRAGRHYTSPCPLGTREHHSTRRSKRPLLCESVLLLLARRALKHKRFLEGALDVLVYLALRPLAPGARLLLEHLLRYLLCEVFEVVLPSGRAGRAAGETVAHAAAFGPRVEVLDQNSLTACMERRPVVFTVPLERRPKKTWGLLHEIQPRTALSKPMRRPEDT